MKLVDVKSSIYIDSGDNVRIYENIFAKGYIPNWYEEDFAIKKIKNTVPWTFVISILTEKKLLDHFTKKQLQKTNKKELRVEKSNKEKMINHMLNQACD